MFIVRNQSLNNFNKLKVNSSLILKALSASARRKIISNKLTKLTLALPQINPQLSITEVTSLELTRQKCTCKKLENAATKVDVKSNLPHRIQDAFDIVKGLKKKCTFKHDNDASKQYV